MVQRSSKLHHPWMISLRHGWWVSATLYLSIDHHLAYINTINQKCIHDTAPFRITASMDDQSSPPYICQLTSSRVYSYSISKMYIWYSAFSNYIIHLDDVIRKGAVSYIYLFDLQYWYTREDDQLTDTQWRRLIRCLIFVDHFAQKSPSIGGSFAENDLHLKVFYVSSPPSTMIWYSALSNYII